ncbi:MAG: cupin domain-containing protein [Ruminococcaceae bacterium]|nr:cupin domain-containing protein [Oscillospiraceae bacterium]
MKFDRVEELVLEHFKDGDGALRTRMVVNDANRFMRGCLKTGCSIGMHTHEDSCEILYVISGQGIALMDGKTEQLSAGDFHYCPKGHAHTLRNDEQEDLVFFAVIPQQ